MLFRSGACSWQTDAMEVYRFILKPLVDLCTSVPVTTEPSAVPTEVPTTLPPTTDEPSFQPTHTPTEAPSTSPNVHPQHMAECQSLSGPICYPQDSWHSSIQAREGWRTCPPHVTRTSGTTCSAACAAAGLQCNRAQDNRGGCTLDSRHTRRTTENNGCEQRWNDQICQCGLPEPAPAFDIVLIKHLDGCPDGYREPTESECQAIATSKGMNFGTASEPNESGCVDWNNAAVGIEFMRSSQSYACPVSSGNGCYCVGDGDSSIQIVGDFKCDLSKRFVSGAAYSQWSSSTRGGGEVARELEQLHVRLERGLVADRKSVV